MRAKDQPIGVDQCNCFTVRKAARQISRLYDSYLQPSGLRITQFLILATLNERESASVNVLSERLDIERTAMGKMIGVLERDGLVAVRPSPEDGRRKEPGFSSERRRCGARRSASSVFGMEHETWRYCVAACRG